MDVYYILYSMLIPFWLLDFFYIPLKAKRICMIILCLVYGLYGGCHSWVGSDWNQYYGVFKDSSWDNIFTYVRYGATKMEFGYMFLNILFKSIFKLYSIFMSIMTFCWLYANGYIFLRYSKFPFIIFSIFFLMECQFLIFRQSIALVFFVISFKYIIEQNLKKFLICIALGASIHNVVFAALPLYWLSRVKINFITANVLYIVVFLFSALFAKMGISLGLMLGGSIADKIAIYSENQVIEEERAFTTTIFNLIILNMTLISMRSSTDISKKIFYDLSIWSFLMCNIVSMLFQDGFHELTRISAGYRLGVCMCWSISLEYIYKKSKLAFSFFVLFLIYYLCNKFMGLPMFSDYAGHIYKNSKPFFN